MLLPAPLKKFIPGVTFQTCVEADGSMSRMHRAAATMGCALSTRSRWCRGAPEVRTGSHYLHCRLRRMLPSRPLGGVATDARFPADRSCVCVGTSFLRHRAI